MIRCAVRCSSFVGFIMAVRLRLSTKAQAEVHRSSFVVYRSPARPNRVA